jgi:two-component sensor histidine kinase
MLGHPLYLVSLITFTLGALAFSVLVLMYFRQRRVRDSRGEKNGGPLLAAFTAACAAAFVINVALQIASARVVDSPLIAALNLALGLTTSLLPPLVFHLMYAKESRHLPHPRVWIFVLVALYAASAGAALLHSAPAGLNVDEWLDSAPALSLGTSAALSLTVLTFSRRSLDFAARHQRRWNQALLSSMLAGAALSIALSSALISLLPDYLLLAFFCVTLYYEERLMFFDLLIKRGAFFAAALLGLPAILMLGFRLAGSPLDWTRAFVCALVLAPCWLIAPWTFRHIESAIDRRWLRRRYSIPDAEQRFIQDVQIAATEDDLRARATASLTEIFQAPASMSDAPGGLSAGGLHIEPRPDGMPFLSDDLRLLQSIARTFGVVLENVRFREREQQLRWLASRAELKALRAQMNPHFLFNALNAIAGLIEDQPRLADETIEQLAHVLRYALRHSENEWVRLDEEIEFVTAYLRVEQARFGDRLHVEFTVDRSAAEFLVPAMTIQPLVENAIKHGVSAVEGAGSVGVTVTLADGQLCVEVSDNGPGFPPGFSIGAGGHGLRNVVERIAGYYGDCANLRWNSGSKGTQVFLTLGNANLDCRR